MFHCFWPELNFAVLWAVYLLFSWPEDPQGPITNLLCSFKGSRDQLKNLTGCYSEPYKNVHISLTRVWQQVWLGVCANTWWKAKMAWGSELSSHPARCSSWTWVLAHITVRNASSYIFPAGLHFSLQSGAKDIYCTHCSNITCLIHALLCL